MRVPVLTYHSINVVANDYARNDHVALAEDLALLARGGWHVVRLRDVVDALEGSAPLPDRAVAISFDDGAWFDWHDLEHPTCGWQRGFAGVLSDARTRTGRPAHATCFVIVSPDARAELDRTCMVGRGWWTDDWWPQAAAGDLLAIESHSWDHNHETLAHTAQHEQRKGTFRTIDTWADADAEIRQASDWLDAHCAQRTALFAYPFGETNGYLVDEYLPRHGAEHRLRAAFTTEPRPITVHENRWTLPRYVAGHHWKSPGELERLLREATRRLV